jgi:hypothetical protein
LKQSCDEKHPGQTDRKNSYSDSRLGLDEQATARCTNARLCLAAEARRGNGCRTEVRKESRRTADRSDTTEERLNLTNDPDGDPNIRLRRTTVPEQQ